MNLDKLFDQLRSQFEREPYATSMGIRLLEVEPGRSLVEMPLLEKMENIFRGPHGGAIFSVIDAAFEIAANSYGTVAVALNMTITYTNPASTGEVLRAEAKEVSKSRRISTYEISVRNEKGDLIAICVANAYRKKDTLPFLK